MKYYKLIIVLVLYSLNIGLCTEKATGLKPFAIFHLTYSINSDPQTDHSFNLTKFGVGLDGTIQKNVGFWLIAVNNNNLALLDAFGFYRFNISTFNYEIQLGQFIPPFSMERFIILPKRDFYELAETTKIIQARDIGIALIAKNDFLEYNIAVVNGNGWLKADNNKVKDIVGRILFFNNQFNLGSSFYIGKSGENFHLTNKNRLNFHGSFQINPLIFQAEYLMAQDSTQYSNSFYLQSKYNLNINHSLIERI